MRPIPVYCSVETAEKRSVHTERTERGIQRRAREQRERKREAEEKREKQRERSDRELVFLLLSCSTAATADL